MPTATGALGIDVVVTAGASAAWDPDAVAGVVNLVLNKKFTGLIAPTMRNTDAWDHES